mgnify:CR=1 FL=1
MSLPSGKHDILVVDDEVQIRRLLRITLESAGHAVREVDAGQLGLDEVAHRAPDAVILDLGLPDMSGLEVLRRLREWSRVPVLVLTVLAGETDKVAALDAGADDYLTKPFGTSELLARIRAILRRVMARRAHGAERIPHFSVCNEIDGANNGACRAQRRFRGARRHDRVRIDDGVSVLLRFFIQHAENRIDMGRIMHRDQRFAGGPRRFVMPKRQEFRCRQRGQHGFQPVRGFGMTGRRKMLKAGFVRN